MISRSCVGVMAAPGRRTIRRMLAFHSTGP